VAWSQGDQVHWAVRSPGAIPGRGLGGGGSGGAALGAAIVVAVAVGGVGTAAWRRRRRSALLDRGPGLM
jgi:hypothetical protein